MSFTNNASDLFVDEFYLSALFDSEGGVLPVSDEKYAYELHLQEALFSAIPNHTTTTTHSYKTSSSGCSSRLIQQQFSQSQEECGESSNSADLVCLICMEVKQPDQIFVNENVCSHVFCTDCIATYLATKLQESIAVVECPEFGCKGTLDPQTCRSFLPQTVYERWENALCESLILGSTKFYCPFKDCSAMLVDDSGEKVTASECPHCRRLFCAQCKVSWHSGMECAEFKSMKSTDGTDSMLVELAKKEKWRRCPKCCFYVEKIDGCKHITCRCKYEFCYGCGAKYTGLKCNCLQT